MDGVSRPGQCQVEPNEWCRLLNRRRQLNAFVARWPLGGWLDVRVLALCVSVVIVVGVQEMSAQSGVLFAVCRGNCR